MNKNILFIFICFFLVVVSRNVCAQETHNADTVVSRPSEEILTDEQTTLDPPPAEESSETDNMSHTIFDDAMLLDGYANKFKDLPIDILLEMIKDDTLSSYKMAAAVRVFRDNFSELVVSREKKIWIKFLWRRLARTTSPFVQVEVMHTMCRLDRYRYFKSMVPALIQKIDHYNSLNSKQ